MKKFSLLSLVGRITSPEVVPGLRGIIMLLIIFKVITVQALKGGGGVFLIWIDRLASLGFVLAVMALGMLLWSKYSSGRKPGKRE